MKHYTCNRTVVSLAAAAACAAFALPAGAQQAATPPAAAASAADADAGTQQIVVTGMRTSLLKSVDLKREAIGTRDSIVAEDIGKFPEQNIADALVRLPGVEVTRDGASNEGQRIQLRGLGAQYTVTTFNGAPVRTTSAGNIGSATRDFNYDVFASELFSRTDLFKSPLAELEEGGVAGAVDLQTPRPFDRRGQIFRYSLAGAYNDLSGKTNPRGHVIFSKTWDRFGFLISAAASRAKNGTSGFETTGGYNSAVQGGIAVQPGITGTVPGGVIGSFPFAWDFAAPGINLNGATPGQLNNAFMPRFIRIIGRANERERVGVNTSFQYKTDRIDVSLDTLHSRLDDDTQQDALSFPIRRLGLSNTAFGGPFTAANSRLVPVNVRIDENNNIQGTVGNVPVQVNTNSNIGETKFDYAALNGRFRVTDQLRLVGQMSASNSSAKRSDSTSNVIDESLAGRHTITYDLSDPFAARVATNRDLLSPLSYTTFGYSGSYRTETDKQRTAKAVGEYDWNLGPVEGTAKVGFGIVQTTKLVNNYSTPNLLNNAVLPNGVLYSNATDAQRQAFIRPQLTPNPLGDIAGRADGEYPREWLTLDRNFLVNTLDAPNQNRLAPLNQAGSFVADETIYSLFVQSDFETEVFGRRLRMNAGVRQLETKTDIDNFRRAAVGFEPSQRQDSYTNTLPSLSLAYDVVQDVVARLSAGRTLTRSSISLLSRTFEVPNGGNLVVNAGNPELKPERSSSLDGSLEWYFARGGVVALGAFQKKISDRAAAASAFVPFNSLGLPVTLFTINVQGELNANPTTPVELRSFANAEQYKVSGLELAYQQQFTNLPEPFNGLGVIGSYTRIRTAGVTRTYNGRDYELPIVPESTYSLTAYYEKGPLALRTSYNHKSEFANVGQTATNTQGFQRWYNDRGYLDASIGYKVSKNLELRLDVANITKTKTYEFFRQFEGLFGDENTRIEGGAQSGRVYTLGLRGSF